MEIGGFTSESLIDTNYLGLVIDRCGYDVAEWFSKRFDNDGTIYEAQINKEHILALFNIRNESEVIVDPTYLMDIVVV